MDEHIEEEEDIAEERAEEAARFGAVIAKRPIHSLTTLKDPICVAPSATVLRAVEVMNEGRVGCVLIVDGEKLVGIFTERDVLRKVVGLGRDAATTPVGEVMTPDPECLTLGDGIGYALNRMCDGGFRRIPLVDADGHPTGVVTMRNIVDAIVDQISNDVRNLPPLPTLETPREREGA
ncbi:MAG: cyclic nucleotide-binding/CBS domain-containing protein [Candidatus Binatia bacterium]